MSIFRPKSGSTAYILNRVSTPFSSTWKAKTSRRKSSISRPTNMGCRPKFSNRMMILTMMLRFCRSLKRWCCDNINCLTKQFYRLTPFCAIISSIQLAPMGSSTSFLRGIFADKFRNQRRKTRVVWSRKSCKSNAKKTSKLKQRPTLRSQKYRSNSSRKIRIKFRRIRKRSISIWRMIALSRRSK